MVTGESETVSREISNQVEAENEHSSAKQVQTDAPHSNGHAPTASRGSLGSTWHSEDWSNDDNAQESTGNKGDVADELACDKHHKRHGHSYTTPLDDTADNVPEYVTLGARVSHLGRTGVVRYIGPRPESFGVFVGVELDVGCGNAELGDGAVLGKRLFGPVAHGAAVFVKPSLLAAESGQNRSSVDYEGHVYFTSMAGLTAAVVLIQRCMRRFLVAKSAEQAQRYQSHASTRDFTAVDVHAQGMAHEYTEDTASALVSPFNNATDKHRAIFAYCTARIRYDTVAFFGNDESTPQDGETVLRCRTAMCGGYANAYVLLARRAGLTVETVSVYAKGFGYTPGTIMERANHAALAVEADGVTSFMDPTWGSGHIKDDGRFEARFKPHYFMIRPKTFVMSHYPENNKYLRLLDGSAPLASLEGFRNTPPPLTLQQFFDKAQVSSFALDRGISLGRSHRDSIIAVDHTETPELWLSMRHPRKMRVKAYLKGRDGPTVNACTRTKYHCPSSSAFAVTRVGITLPGAGTYELKLMVSRPEVTVIEPVVFYRVDVAGGPSVEEHGYTVPAASRRPKVFGIGDDLLTSFEPQRPIDCEETRFTVLLRSELEPATYVDRLSVCGQVMKQHPQNPHQFTATATPSFLATAISLLLAPVENSTTRDVMVKWEMNGDTRADREAAVSSIFRLRSGAVDGDTVRASQDVRDGFMANCTLLADEFTDGKFVSRDNPLSVTVADGGSFSVDGVGGPAFCVPTESGYDVQVFRPADSTGPSVVKVNMFIGADNVYIGTLQVTAHRIDPKLTTFGAGTAAGLRVIAPADLNPKKGGTLILKFNESFSPDNIALYIDGSPKGEFIFGDGQYAIDVPVTDDAVTVFAFNGINGSGMCKWT